MRLMLFLCCKRRIGRARPGAGADPLAPLEPATPTEQPAAAEPPATPAQPAQPAPPPPPPSGHPQGLARRASAPSTRGLGSGAGWDRRAAQRPAEALARAELFTAKGFAARSSWRRSLPLLAEAPELPQAEQLQRLAMAARRDRAAGRSTGRARPCRWAARRAAARPARSAASPPPTQLRLALEPLVKVDDAAGAEALFLTSAAVPVARSPGRGRPAGRLDLFRQRPRRRRAPRRRLRPRRRDRRMGRAGGLDLRPGRLADERLERGLRRVPRGARRSPANPSSRRGPLLDRARRPGQPPPAARSRRCFAPPRARRKASTACWRARRWAWTSACPRPPRRATSAGSRPCPTSAARPSWSAIGGASSAEELLRHQAKIGSPPTSAP